MQEAQPPRQEEVSRCDEGQIIDPNGTTESWRVTYLLRSTAQGWRRHKSPHIVMLGSEDGPLLVKDSGTGRTQERVDLKCERNSLKVAFVGDDDGKSIIRFAVAKQPVRKFALVADCGREAAELCRALHRRGVKVHGMEDLPDVIFLRGDEQRGGVDEALEDSIPSLSRPEVQAYVVRLLFQDSFHEFVHDLSEMFTHVQHHMPSPHVPPLNPSPAPVPPSSEPHLSPGDVAPGIFSSSPETTSREEGSLSPPQSRSTSSPGRGHTVATQTHPGTSPERRCASLGGPDVLFTPGIPSREPDPHPRRYSPIRVAHRTVQAETSARPPGQAAGDRREVVEGSIERVGVDCISAGSGDETLGESTRGEVRKTGGDTRGNRVVSSESGVGEDRGEAREMPEASRCDQARSPTGSRAGIRSTCQGAGDYCDRRGEVGRGSKRGRQAKTTSKKQPAPPNRGRAGPYAGSTARGSSPNHRRSNSRDSQCDCQRGGSATRGKGGRRAKPGSEAGLDPSRRKRGRTCCPASENDRKRTKQRPRASCRRAPQREPQVWLHMSTAGTSRSREVSHETQGGQPRVKDRTGLSSTSKGYLTNPGGSGQDTGSGTRTEAGRVPAAAAAAVCRGERCRNEVRDDLVENRKSTSTGSATGTPCADHRRSRYPLRREVGLASVLRHAWTKINQHPSVWAFRKPVDVSEAPDYFDIVKDPIDLEIIGTRLQRELYYETKTMFQHDLTLMCHNAMLYNEENTPHYRAGQELLTFVRSVLDADDSGEATTNT